MKLYFYWTKMAAKGVKEYSAICSMMFIILCLLCSMPCATTLNTDSHNQSSNNFASSSLQGFSSGTINADGGTTVKGPSACDTTLENGPKNKTRNEGQRVSLNCDLSNDDNRPVLWKYFSGSGMSRYISKNNQIYSHDGYDEANYKVVINESLQTYKLIIKAATFPTDSGTYQCGYECNSVSFIPLALAVVTILPKFDPSPSCQMNLLPSLQSEEDSDNFEIICFWTQGYEGNAHFKNAYGEDVQIHLNFPGRIISRIKASNVPNITCQFMFSTSSSEKMKAPCRPMGNERTGILSVDPFINKVTVYSDAIFTCSFLNQSDLNSGYWKIHYGANVSLFKQENLIENQKFISLVNVSESHQSILVECALNVSENEKISSFGAILITRMTTTPPDENPTQWTTNNISKTTTDSSESRPTTVTLLPEATIISVSFPQVSVPTSTVSKSVRPTTSTRILSEASSISATSPLTLVTTTATDISESTRSTTATRMLSEGTTTTVTTLQTSAATTSNIIAPQIPGAPICKFYPLPSKLSLDRDFEVVCSWNHSQAYQAQLQRSNGETIYNSLIFDNRIISRVKLSGSNSINCRLSLNSNTSMAEINTTCIEKYKYGLLKVDPFVVEVYEGSSAVFTCNLNDRGHESKLSWEVHSSGNLSAVDHNQSELYPNVNFAVYKQKDGENLLVECHLRLDGNRNMSSYGLLRIIEGTTLNLTTPSGEGQTNQITDRQSVKSTTVKSTTNQNMTETRPPVKMTTMTLPTSSEGVQTSQITDNTSVQTREFTTNHDNTSETHTPPSSKKGLAVMISISVLVAVVILLLSLAIVYLLRKQKRMSLPRRLSEDGKTDAIELSNIPHILHEESSEWYALSFKDKRVQDMQGQQSSDLIVKHDDESDQNIPMLSSSLGIPSLHLLESIDENVYAEPDVSEEPIRQTISRQQCTFTPLLEDEQ